MTLRATFGGSGGASSPASRLTIGNSTAPTANNVGTGALLDMPMFSATVPGAAIIPQSGILILTANIAYTSSASAKAIQCFYGGVKVVNSLPLPANTSAALIEVFITNTGVKNAQISYARVTTTSGVSVSPNVASTVDSSVVQNLGLYSELTASGDVMNTVTWKVEASN